jgi:hypothetical protein
MNVADANRIQARIDELLDTVIRELWAIRDDVEAMKAPERPSPKSTPTPMGWRSESA